MVGGTLLAVSLSMMIKPCLQTGFLIAALAFCGACDGDDDGGVDASPTVDGALADATSEAPDAGGAGAACGGFAGLQCDQGQWCDYGNNICGGDDSQGMCRPIPDACPDVVDPVCGCDGETYGNECEANAAGIDIAANGSCEPAAGTFVCGPRFCQAGAEYCERSVSDVGGLPDTYRCNLSTACDDRPSCACLAEELCGDMCTTDENQNPTVTCPGG